MRCYYYRLILVGISLSTSCAFTVPKSIQNDSSLNISRGGAKKKKVKPKVVLSSTIAAGDASSSSSGGGTATIPNEIFNLVKNIVGAGVLSLPAGVAAFGSAPSAILPATILIATVGSASGYCFSLIGRVCSLTSSKTYREAWEKSVGPSTSWIPAASCTAKTLSAILAYSMILADTFKALLATAGYNISRSNTLFAVTGLFLLPLCLLKDLSSLAPFSLLGVMGMIYTAVAMGFRYFARQYKLPEGLFLPDLQPDLQPAFGNLGASSIMSPNAFILICMLSTAFMAHFNAPKFFVELKDNTISRYNTVVSVSFALSIAMFASIAAFGYLTFGTASNGLILNNYSTKDALMSMSRVAVAISLIFSYPLAFVGARDGVLDLFNTPMSARTNATLNKLTVLILGFVTFLALKVKDLSFVLSFAGATLGNALIYIYPALMFRGAVKKMGLKKRAEVTFASLLALLGVGMGGIGAKMAIASLAK